MQISPGTGDGASRAAEQAAELAAELYLVPPVRFVETRDLIAQQAAAAGQPELSARLRELRRPTQSAWLVNLLVRNEPAIMTDLRALGRQLREAQTVLAGEELRRLSERRRVLVGELTEAARQHAMQAGVTVHERAITEVEATLNAALVDLAAACAVSSGRLVRPMSHNGFGPRPRLPEETPLRPAGVPADDDWLFWPASPEIHAEVAVDDDFDWYADDEPDPAPVRRRHLSLVPPVDDAGQPPPDPDASALAEAEEAARAARDEVTWFDQARMLARTERVAAEQALEQARKAMEARKARQQAEQTSLFDLDQD